MEREKYQEEIRKLKVLAKRNAQRFSSILSLTKNDEIKEISQSGIEHIFNASGLDASYDEMDTLVSDTDLERFMKNSVSRDTKSN